MRTRCRQEGISKLLAMPKVPKIMLRLAQLTVAALCFFGSIRRAPPAPAKVETIAHETDEFLDCVTECTRRFPRERGCGTFCLLIVRPPGCPALFWPCE